MEQVSKELKLNRREMKLIYDRSCKTSKIKVGDIVWFQIVFVKPGENKMLAPARKGPYAVLEVMENGFNFRIKKLNRSEVQIVHHDRLMKQPIQPNGSTEGNISREKVMDKIK